MANAPRSSFIPKQTSATAPKAAVRRKQVFSVFGVFATLSLIGALLSAGGVFAYTYYLEGKLENQKTALSREYEKFNEAEIYTVQAVDAKLRAAEYLLDNHASPSKIFAALETNTKRSVQYTSFLYERRPSGNVTLNITGVTNEFAKVSLQWRQYLEDVVLADVLITKIGLDPADESGPLPGFRGDERDVNFALAANIRAENIPYTPSVAEDDVNDVPFENESSSESGAEGSVDDNEESAPPAPQVIN